VIVIFKFSRIKKGSIGFVIENRLADQEDKFNNMNGCMEEIVTNCYIVDIPTDLTFQ